LIPMSVLLFSSANYTWINDDINIDFSTLTSDPDGIGVGVTDADGDGFFDDLPGGQMLNISVELDFVCALPPDPTSIACSQLVCSFSQFYVEASRDCGSSFKVFPTITPFDIINGATSITSNEVQVGNSFFGIDFGATGTSGAKTQTVEMCYIYERENVTPCPDANTNNKLQVVYSGSPSIVQDVELVANTIFVNGAAVADSEASWTYVDESTRVLNINAGSNDLGTEVCYSYDLQVDTTLCAPNIYMVGNHQVIEECDTGTCSCNTVKACESILFRSNPNASGCSCDLQQGVSQMYRLNTGYTDETCTTKVLPEDVPLVDKNRYLPGDTMFYETYYVFASEESIRRDLYQLGLRTFFRATGNRFDVNELTVNPQESSIIDFSIKKLGGASKTSIALDQIPSCIDSGPESAGGTNIFFGSHPWGDNIETFYQPTRDCINSSFDFYDNNYVSLFFYNQNDLQACRGITSLEDNGNCIQDWFNEYDVQVGDTLFLTQHLKLIKNPIAAVNGRPQESQLKIWGSPFISVLDDFFNNCSSTRSTCREDRMMGFRALELVLMHTVIQ